MSAAGTDGPEWAPGLRYLTADEPPIPLRFKKEPEDFRVEEIRSFEPSPSSLQFEKSEDKSSKNLRNSNGIDSACRCSHAD